MAAAATIAASTPLPAKMGREFSFNHHASRDTKLVVVKITFDGGDYGSGGVAVDFSDYIGSVDHVLIAPISGYVLEWVPSTEKVKVYEAGADAAALDEYADTAISLVTWAWVIGH